MPNLSATEIVDLGEYLSHSFNPMMLTIPQLLGILGHHGIAFPSPYSKPKLVRAFIDNIQANSDALTQERLKLKHVPPSNEGIVDVRAGGRSHRRSIGKKDPSDMPRAGNAASRPQLKRGETGPEDREDIGGRLRAIADGAPMDIDAEPLAEESPSTPIFPLVDISPVVSVAPASSMLATQDSQENQVDNSLLDGVKAYIVLLVRKRLQGDINYGRQSGEALKRVENEALKKYPILAGHGDMITAIVKAELRAWASELV
ncbi:hypothetical protein FA13DRAFT_1784919 [Coprinellus micaceus]|uniref:HeH/LEM domain-containing protein n=1 Tax=Coprinellus micaceus TaxID=71717 RepID=A0A4Y7TX76_COPMI|nr:hypothetical protein FA13DRAFT_1784919 [Coprinellus micaceus]